VANDKLIIDVEADIDDADRDLTKVKNKVDDVDDATKRAGKSGGGFGSVLGGIGKVAGVAAGGVGLLAGGLAMAGKAAAEEEVGIARLNQTLENSIPNWDGNTGAIDAYIAKQEKLSFADDELRDSLNQLVAQTKDLGKAQELQALAMDLARAKGMDLQTASKLVGKVDAENIGILQRYGIMVDKNATSEEALAAIRQQTAGQAETYANTTAGSMERIQNSLGNLLESIGGPVLAAVQGPLAKLAEWFQSDATQAGITALAEVIGQRLAKAFEFVGGVIGTVGPPLEAAFSAFRGFFQFIQNTLTGDEFLGFEEFLEGIVPDPVLNLANAFGELLSNARGFVEGLIPQFQAGLGSIGGIFESIGPQIGGFIDLIIGMAQERIAVLADIFGSVWGIISGFFAANGADILSTFQGWLGQLIAFAGPILEGVQTIFMTVFGAIRDFLQEHGTEIQNLLTMAWDTIKTVIDGAMVIIRDIVIPIFSAIATFIGEHGEQIKGVLSGVWTAISSIIGGAMGVIQGIVNTAMALIKGDWEGVWNGIKSIGESIWNGITGALGGVFEALKNLVTIGLDAIKGLWEGIWNSIGGFLTGIWNGLVSAVSTGIDNVIQFFKDLPGNLWNLVLEVGRSIIDGIISGLAAAGDAIKNFLLGLITGAVDAVKSFFGISSPSKLMAYYGEMLGLGLAGGIGKSTPGVMRAMSKLNRSVMQGLGGTVALAANVTGGATVLRSAAVGAPTRGGGADRLDRMMATRPVAVTERAGYGPIDIKIENRDGALMPQTVRVISRALQLDRTLTVTGAR
jgi:phage-related protein